MWLVKVKVNLTIFSTSLSKKHLFRDISCTFLIRVLISVVSLSLSSNKLHNVHFFYFLLGVKKGGGKGRVSLLPNFEKGMGDLTVSQLLEGVV